MQALRRIPDFALERGIARRVEAVVARALAIAAGFDDGVEMSLGEFRAGDKSGDLLLLDHLPLDEVLDVGMIDIDDDHLGGSARWCRPI
jgi:hypothetical protein